MKKSRNIPAAICFALALIFLALACVGVNLDKEAVQNAKSAAPAATQVPSVSYDSRLSDASRVDVLTGTISDAPAPTQKAPSFDYRGFIQDGKVQGAESSKTTPAPTQKAPSFDYRGFIQDGKVQGAESSKTTPAPTQKAPSFDYRGFIQDGKVQGAESSKTSPAPTQKAPSLDSGETITDGKVQGTEATEAPGTAAEIVATETQQPAKAQGTEATAAPETPAPAAEPVATETRQPGKVHVFLVDYAGTLALIGFVFLGLWLICLCVVPVIQTYRRDKLTFENLNAGQRVLKMFTLAPNKWAMYLLITMIVAILIAWSSSSIEWKGLASKGSEVAYGIVHGITHPVMSYILSLGSDKVPYLMMQTIAIALLGTIFGGILAIPVAFLCAENVVPKWLAFIVRALVLAIRTIPSIIWALCWIRVTGPGALCGVMTQSICSIGMISKMYTTAIEDLDTRILESLDAAGCNTFQKIRYGILPQLTANFISTIIYRFDINLKDATTLGIVGAGGIGASLIQAINSRRWGIVGAFLCGMIALMLVIEFVSTRIRAKLAHGE